ncbi:hypothetical protein AB0C87_24755 [Actinomadura sp. NPDC048021]|uniref:hypothetical protein n=1 Tax=Actinomadura sp. NPDC048021 TaxID=3155385 RepID=UPI0033C3E7F4
MFFNRYVFEKVVGKAGLMIYEGAKGNYEAGLLEGRIEALEEITGIPAEFFVFAVADAYLDGSEDEALAGKLIAEQLDKKFILPSA